MNLFRYYSTMRSELLETISGVKNANRNLYFDDTTPNWSIKDKLEKLFNKYLDYASKLGFYVVTRHCECPNPKHTGYPISNAYGIEIKYQDSDYVWTGIQFYQGKRKCICPCSVNNQLSGHHIIDDVIFNKNSDQNLCNIIEGILSDINNAIYCADDQHPRSSIREQLLRAVLKINDQLLPEPMEDYIQKKCCHNS